MARKPKKGSTPSGFGEERQPALDRQGGSGKSATASKESATSPEQGKTSNGKAERRLLKIGAEGRVLIPADWREAMQLKESDTLVGHLQDGELRLHGSAVGLRRARAILRKYVREGESLVDDLIEERRREVAAEDDSGKTR